MHLIDAGSGVTVIVIRDCCGHERGVPERVVHVNVTSI